MATKPKTERSQTAGMDIIAQPLVCDDLSTALLNTAQVPCCAQGFAYANKPTAYLLASQRHLPLSGLSS